MSAISIIENQRIEMNAIINKFEKESHMKFEDEDLEKALYLLRLHPDMSRIIKDYEFAQTQMESGMSEYSLANAEGNARFGEHGRELQKDVTADSVVLKHKSAAIYELYKTISKIVCTVIENLRDPHERAIFKMLFIQGKRLIETVNYMERGYVKELYPISRSNFCSKRRDGLKKVAASLKLTGVLHVVQVDERESRIQKKVVFRMAIS